MALTQEAPAAENVTAARLIRQLLQMSGLTLEQAAALTNVDPSTISRQTSGKQEASALRTVLVLSGIVARLGEVTLDAGELEITIRAKEIADSDSDSDTDVSRRDVSAPLARH